MAFTRVVQVLCFGLMLPVTLSLTLGCSDGETCGPSRARVERAIDGDTVALQRGERIRYLLVDTPEIKGEIPECYGREARAFNAWLVEGQLVQLDYDEQCRDRFGRLLAYVSVGGRELNRLLVERGFACVLWIPPNGGGRASEFLKLEEHARTSRRGLWGECASNPCR